MNLDAAQESAEAAYALLVESFRRHWAGKGSARARHNPKDSEHIGRSVNEEGALMPAGREVRQ